MSLPGYPRYTSVGAPWLGEVPDHWGVSRLKDVICSIESGTSVNAVDEPAGDGELAVLKTSCVYQGYFDPAENKTVAPDEADRVTCPVIAGSLIVSRMNTPELIGAAGLVQESRRNLLLPDRLWQIALGGVNSRFVYWWTRSATYRGQVEAACTGTSASMKNLAQEQFTSFVVPLPSRSEQADITGFLDRETAKIDALVAEQRRLIELLKEKRAAVISHAVTKGLNPDVLMKPSGIEWLGDVPAHWRMNRLKHLSPFITVGIVVNPSTYIAEEGLPFIYGGDVSEEAIDWQSARRISVDASAHNAKTQLHEGDLVTIRVGAPGVTSVVPPQCEGGNCASVMLIRRGGFSSDWLCYTMNSRTVRYQVEVVQYGAAQEQFNISHAVDFVIPTPPAEEQRQIATELRARTSALDELITSAAIAIDFLHERRAALISAAVTGQIDVRGLAPSEAP